MGLSPGRIVCVGSLVSAKGFRGRAGELGNRGLVVLVSTGRGVVLETGLPLEEDEEEDEVTASLQFTVSLGSPWPCRGEVDEVGGLGKLFSDELLC